jgi:hypothetical protein
MSVGSDNFGGLGSGMARFDSLHNQVSPGGTMRYPSPFFDIGHTYLPTSVSQMFRWCRYYFLTNPLINAVVYKMAEYPITPLIFDEENTQLREHWENVSENVLKIRPFEIEVGLDYFCYGNGFVSIHFPFRKYLTCPQCKKETLIQKADYKFRNTQYYMNCEGCHTTVEAKVKDVNYKDVRGIRLLRWNPENVRIEHNELTGETDYFFDIPTVTKNDILMGKRHIVETIPDVFVEAIRSQRQVKFTHDNVFHLKRPTIAQKDMGWGMPIILPVLKDAFYLQILRKAQEAIAHQHIVPLRILFPQGGDAQSSPYSMTDLGMWRKRIEVEISKWRSDPNYIPIMPLPLGNEVIGGEGKALMLHQEMRSWSEQIVAGMHVPIEFVFGGLQYSGSNVSMRMLENQFLGYRTSLIIMVRDFILGRVADYMEWKRPKCHFGRFKMADDLQRTALVFQLNQAMKVSDTTLLAELDFDVEQEEKFKATELSKQLGNQRKMQMANASIQGDVSVLQAKYQAQVQKTLQAMGIDPNAAAQQSQQMDQAIQGIGDQQDGQVPGGGAPPGTASGLQDQQPDHGAEAAPGFPEGATAYPEKANPSPAEGVPTEMVSPLNISQTTGGYPILYLANRAATFLRKQDPPVRMAALQSMKGENPQLYQAVNQILASDIGSQTDGLDSLQSPLPDLRPPRRKKSII